jgi:cbb3-type cytochrome oxidase subunit 1
MRKIYVAAHVYMILGLVSGLYYRELTKAKDFTGDSQLGIVHTHILALGMLFFLIVLVLEKQFTLTSGKLFDAFFWVYNAGLALTIGMMLVRGTMTVLGHQAGAALDGISGLGHIVITLGLIFFFVNLGKSLPVKEKAEALK